MSFCLYNKKNITRRLEDMNFISRGKNNILLAALVRKILFCHSKIKFISSRHRVISSLSFHNLCVDMYVNETKFERNSSLEYYHMTCNGKTKHTS